MVPQISGGIPATGIRYFSYPSFTFRYTPDNIAGNVDGVEAIKQTILHVLSTERYDYLIYSKDYGVELRQFIGKGIGFLRETVEDVLRDALLQDDRISGVTVTQITQEGVDAVHIEMTVTTTAGNIHTGVEISV